MQVVEFWRPLRSPAGGEVREGEKGLTVGMALLPAILGSWTGDKRSAGRKVRDVEIGLEIMKGGGVELGDEDRGHLRDVAFETIPGAYFFVQVAEALGFTAAELQTP